MTKFELYKKLIEKNGEKQIIVAIEELSELQKELCKHLRKKTNELNLIEEIADVEIMLEQIKLYFNISSDLIKEYKKEKLIRTKERLINKQC